MGAEAARLVTMFPCAPSPPKSTPLLSFKSTLSHRYRMCSKAGVRRTLQLCTYSFSPPAPLPAACLSQTPSGSDALFVLQSLSRDLALSATAPCDNAIARLPELLQQFDR
jgi:hypothetical protein